MKKDFIPIARIRGLIDSLSKHANIYNPDYLEQIKKANIWDNFQAENINGIMKEKSNKKISAKQKSRSESILGLVNKKKTKFSNHTALENFSDIQVRALFFDFIISLFEAYDESKHYIIDQNDPSHDKTFDIERFIIDSKNDIKPFLGLLKNLPVHKYII